MKKLPKGIRKHIRRQKAIIRKEEKYNAGEEEIKKLFSKYYKKNKK